MERFVPDGVTSSETDPLRDRSVLLLRLGELLLRAERLVALFVIICQPLVSIMLSVPARFLHPALIRRRSPKNPFVEVDEPSARLEWYAASQTSSYVPAF